MGCNESKQLYVFDIIYKDDPWEFSRHYDSVSTWSIKHRVDMMHEQDKYRNELLCLCCITEGEPKINIYKYMTKNYQLDYNVLLEFILLKYSRKYSPKHDTEVNEIINDIIYKTKVYSIDNDNLMMMLKENLCSRETLNYCMQIEDKDVFNRIIKNPFIDKDIVLYCKQFATDEEAIDNVLLKYHESEENLDKIHDINRQFNEKYFPEQGYMFAREDIILINKYGILVISLTEKYESLIGKIINKDVLLKVVVLEDKDKHKVKINIESLKLIEDCENFHDFISLNRCFLMNCTKTNDEVDYLMKLL